MKNAIVIVLLVALSYALVQEQGGDSAAQTVDSGAPTPCWNRPWPSA